MSINIIRLGRAVILKGLLAMWWVGANMRSLWQRCRWWFNYQTSYSRPKGFHLQPVLRYIESARSGSDGYAFKYTPHQPEPVLYASAYAASLLHLLGQATRLSEGEKRNWVRYIQGYQCEDGLFRDPAVANEIAETEDWWGWRHLTCHAIMALAALETKAERPFKTLEFLYRVGEVRKWLASRDWQNSAASVSNEVLNYGTLLQYARDFHGNRKAAEALHEMYDWLDEHQDAKTGLWGPPPGDKCILSLGVQTAYHIWLLYFYDRRPIQYMEQCIDSCLATQNRLGGFGADIASSACEDIDSIDPLVRFYFLTDYRRADIKKALEKSYKWVLANMNEDGGFVFVRGKPLVYGHRLMSSKANESALFPTWFRVLSLAYLGKVINVPELRDIEWSFVDCPGYQFWRD